MAIRPPVALIAGPTASGKSALALALAEETAGVTINADSAQLYRDLAVLSAGPTPEHLARAEHRLYRVLDGANACSAADWAAMARAEIEEAHHRGVLPILVGGTGLYIRTLLEGIAPIPPITDAVRALVRSRRVEENRKELEAHDPEAAARLKPADSARIARALEVVLSTGEPLAHWQAQRTGGLAEAIDLRPLILLPPREWLYRRCDERFSAMVEQGAVSEVEALLKRKLSPNLPVMRAIGVREIASFLRAEIDLDQAILAARQSTRRYAKRQYTWLAHQPPSYWPRFTRPLDGQSMDEALALLRASA